MLIGKPEKSINRMSTNTNTNSTGGNGDASRPLTMDVVIPGENVVLDHWVVSSGSAVRANETIAFVRKRSDNGNTSDTIVAAAPAAAPKHKRPTRRKKGAKGSSVVPDKTEKPSSNGSSSSSSSSSSATKSTAMSLKELLAAKTNNRKAESSTATNQTGNEMEIETQETKTASTSTSTVATKTNQTTPIHAPATGILRIYSSSTQNNEEHPQRKLVIGVIEECLHPTFVGGMCVVCGALRASIKEGKNAQTITDKSSSQKTSQVTVSGGVTMTVSLRESESMALLDSERLFRKKKLSLVLDLDHTLVHATADPRARQYLDPSHPQAVAKGDIRIISLPMFEGADGKNGIDPRQKYMRSQHYVKLRPYVKEFFEGVKDTYEVSVYTAGTRQYAEEIAMVLCRNLAGSAIDSDELEQLRHTVKMAEEEYARNLKDDKKRTIDQMPPDEGMDGKETNEQPPRKKKKISFGGVEFSDGTADKMKDDRNDCITKEKLATMQAELRSAETLELKAKYFRQTVFGSRIVSRTDVGDLGRDVKSLKRVFPCGGTMAAVVDDREDVWANAKDNSNGTIKGEPPDNLLLCRPYHWQPFVGFADVNNAAGADLSGSGPSNADTQLLWTKKILEKLHLRYYQQSTEGNRKTVPETLKQMRREVMMGSNFVLSGLVPLHKQSNNGAVARPHFVRYAQNLGAKVRIDSSQQLFVCLCLKHNKKSMYISIYWSLNHLHAHFYDSSNLDTRFSRL